MGKSTSYVHFMSYDPETWVTCDGNITAGIMADGKQDFLQALAKALAQVVATNKISLSGAPGSGSGTNTPR